MTWAQRAAMTAAIIASVFALVTGLNTAAIVWLVLR